MQNKIYEKLDVLIQAGKRKFAIYPYGEMGIQVQNILIENYKIEDSVFIDSSEKLDSEYIVLLVNMNRRDYYQTRTALLENVSQERIVDVFLDYGADINVVNSIQKGINTRVIFNPIHRWPGAKAELSQVGGNTGNLVFVEGLKRNVDFDYESFLTLEWKKEFLGRENVRAIMPAANFLSKETKWIENLVPILESTDMSFTLAGLGAQAKLNETPNDVVSKLSTGQKRFFSLVGERACTIGVRGEFTAECLDLLGIENVDIIGCPSFYSCEGHYPLIKKASLDKVMCTKSGKDIKIHEISEMVNATVISQVNGDDKCGCKNIFYDFDEWNKFIQKNDFTFSFGTRFHGNMMALNNGVPTLWIVHDWRTLELAQYLKLPYINYYQEFQNITKPEQLLDYCDYGELYKSYADLYKNYREFIGRNL